MLNDNLKFTDDDFDKYGDLEGLKAKLEELRNFDFSNKTHKEISDLINLHLDSFPALTVKYPADQYNKFKFYRVRQYVNTDLEDLNLIQTYSYPLPQFCKANGRANLENMSVFYCSNHAITAVIESKPKVGDVGYLSIWEGKSNRDMLGGVVLPKTLKRENEWHALSDDIYQYVENIVDQKLTGKQLHFHEKLKFVADLFITESPPYPITSLISYELLYGKSRQDFIVYPSFKNDSHSCNLAFHPNVINNFMDFKKVIRFKVLSIENGNYSISTGNVGELQKNNIIWRTAEQDELNFALFPG